MTPYLIAQRYANGLLAAVEDTSEIESLDRGLQEMSALYQENRELHDTLNNGGINLDERCAVLREVLQAAELPEVLGHLGDVLMRRGRINLLSYIATVFTYLADRRLNRVTAEVTSAVELSDEQQERIREALARRSGQTVTIETQVDPEILGGVVARVGSTVIDGSLRARIERLRETLIAEE